MAADVIRPASLFQRCMVSVDRVQPGFVTGPWFTLSTVVELTGPLDHAILNTALEELLGRHELLRSRLVHDGTDPVQVVAARVAVPLERVDNDEVSAAGGWTHAPVASDRPSPLVIRVASRSRDEHVLSLHLNHLMSDPATVWGVLTELAALYSAIACGHPRPQPPSAQYGQFAACEVEQAQRGEAAARQWWRTATTGRFASVHRRDRSAPYAFREQILTATEFATARRLAAAHRATPLTTLFAALSCAMRPYVSDGGPMFTTAFNRRDRPEWQRMLGPCVHLALVPLPPPPEQLTAEYARAVRDRLLGAQRHCRLDVAEVRAMTPFFDDPGNVTPFFEYVPNDWPSEVRFGEATGRVVSAAGPKDVGYARGLAVRARANAEHALTAHVSADGEGWTDQIARHLWRNVATQLTQATAPRALKDAFSA